MNRIALLAAGKEQKPSRKEGERRKASDRKSVQGGEKGRSVDMREGLLLQHRGGGIVQGN